MWNSCSEGPALLSPCITSAVAASVSECIAAGQAHAQAQAQWGSGAMHQPYAKLGRLLLRCSACKAHYGSRASEQLCEHQVLLDRHA